VALPAAPRALNHRARGEPRGGGARAGGGYYLGDFKVDVEHCDHLDALIARFRSQKDRSRNSWCRASIRTSAVPVRKPSRTLDTRCPLPDPCDGKNVPRRVAIRRPPQRWCHPHNARAIPRISRTTTKNEGQRPQATQNRNPTSAAMFGPSRRSQTRPGPRSQGGDTGSNPVGTTSAKPQVRALVVNRPAS
jgi:hypothetical protein